MMQGGGRGTSLCKSTLAWKKKENGKYRLLVFRSTTIVMPVAKDRHSLGREATEHSPHYIHKCHMIKQG